MTLFMCVDIICTCNFTIIIRALRREKAKKIGIHVEVHFKIVCGFNGISKEEEKNWNKKANKNTINTCT